MNNMPNKDSDHQVIMDLSVSAVSLHSSTYNIFIMVLTIFSLVLMVLLVLPVQPAVKETVEYMDTIICLIFLGDFVSNLVRSPSKSRYFFKGGGWLDLIGSIPSTTAIPLTALFRLARLGRLARIILYLRETNARELWKDFRSNRARSSLLLTIFTAIVVITISAIVVLQVENARGNDPNITTGGDAFWWAFVTITTVGYGDRFPMTGLGRMMAMILMTIGVGVFGVLTSYLAATFLAPESAAQTEELSEDDIYSRLDLITEEISSIKKLMEQVEIRLQTLDSDG